MDMPSFWLRRTIWSWFFWPMSKLFALVVFVRRALYKWQIFKSYQATCPVIIVGNLSVGGTGKTPLVIALVEWLKTQGWQPAIVSRGYKSQASNFPCLVTTSMTAEFAGDEPALMAKATQVPVVIDPQRARAIKFLTAEKKCNIVVCDDGLQHYALARDLEIVVFDHDRQFGNGFLLPAGMLREPLSRLKNVDAVVCNGGLIYVPGVPAIYDMHLRPSELIALDDLSLTCNLTDFKKQTVHAVAGIGNPARFFDLLRKYGLDVIEHSFADHHAYKEKDFSFNTNNLPIIMTEKDAVKCQGLVKNAWYLPVFAMLSEAFYQAISKKLGKEYD